MTSAYLNATFCRERRSDGRRLFLKKMEERSMGWRESSHVVAWTPEAVRGLALRRNPHHYKRVANNTNTVSDNWSGWVGFDLLGRASWLLCKIHSNRNYISGIGSIFFHFASEVSRSLFHHCRLVCRIPFLIIYFLARHMRCSQILWGIFLGGSLLLTIQMSIITFDMTGSYQI